MQFITKEEFDKIIDTRDFQLMSDILERLANKVIEASIQAMPALTAALIKNSLAIHSMSTKFINDNPYFKGYGEIVQNVIHKVELANPGLLYQQILEKSVPLINEEIAKVKRLSPV